MGERPGEVDRKKPNRRIPKLWIPVEFMWPKDGVAVEVINYNWTKRAIRKLVYVKTILGCDVPCWSMPLENKLDFSVRWRFWRSIRKTEQEKGDDDVD